MDDLVPLPAQPATDRDRNQPDDLVLTRKRSKEKKDPLRLSGKRREEPDVEEKLNLDVLA